jgi:hypothetical protein
MEIKASTEYLSDYIRPEAVGDDRELGFRVRAGAH